MPVTVALDGRGAERGARVVIDGARVAAANGLRLRVFGDGELLAEIRELDGAELIPATEEITNADEPVAAVRSRPEASVVQAAADVAEGRSEALVSAGSTGATMTAALVALRRMQGVRRPALALQLPVPGSGRPLLLLDVGANTEARAVDLVQFAYLGSAFSAAVRGVERPRVALLSVGEEQKKGSADVVEANARLADASGIEFIGNIEGRDLMERGADVVVTDGFTGNVLLKGLETAYALIGTPPTEQPVPAPPRAAVLLGVAGTVVVCHGAADAADLAGGIAFAADLHRLAAVATIAELIGNTEVIHDQ